MKPNIIEQLKNPHTKLFFLVLITSIFIVYILGYIELTTICDLVQNNVENTREGYRLANFDASYCGGFVLVADRVVSTLLLGMIMLNIAWVLFEKEGSRLLFKKRFIYALIYLIVYILLVSQTPMFYRHLLDREIYLGLGSVLVPFLIQFTLSAILSIVTVYSMPLSFIKKKSTLIVVQLLLLIPTFLIIEKMLFLVNLIGWIEKYL